jgi:hypothetical protein
MRILRRRRLSLLLLLLLLMCSPSTIPTVITIPILTPARRPALARILHLNPLQYLADSL